MPAPVPFWKSKRLDEMTTAEWESLCDGCGRCCLHKLRDEETDTVIFTNVACRLLDTHSCACSDYERRQRKVPDCVQLTPASLAEIDWLPPSCAYRRLQEGRGLAWWHPLVSGRRETVHEAGISAQDRVIGEREAGPLEHHVVDWPGRMPRSPAKPGAPAKPDAPAKPQASKPQASAKPQAPARPVAPSKPVLVTVNGVRQTRREPGTGS